MSWSRVSTYFEETLKSETENSLSITDAIIGYTFLPTKQHESNLFWIDPSLINSQGSLFPGQTGESAKDTWSNSNESKTRQADLSNSLIRGAN